MARFECAEPEADVECGSYVGQNQVWGFCIEKERDTEIRSLKTH